MMYVLLVLGFLLLIKGADFFVDGSSALAAKLKIPSIIIGLTIVAMGTSAPEAAVSLTASLAGNNDISLGNIVGSNIFNLLVVAGASAVILPIVSEREILRRDMVWNVAVSAALLALGLDGKISRPEGFLLLAAMAAYLFVIVKSALKNRKEEEAEKIMSVPKMLLLMTVGLAAVIAGGNLVVNNASLIASSLGMSDTLIGLTIVAIGTSLPELVTSIAASRRGDSGIAIGNAVGSCLFNIMFILGMAAAIVPITVAPELMVDMAILTGVSAVMFLFAVTKKKTTRLEGCICVVLYLCYSAYIILR